MVRLGFLAVDGLLRKQIKGNKACWHIWQTDPTTFQKFKKKREKLNLVTSASFLASGKRLRGSSPSHAEVSKKKKARGKGGSRDPKRLFSSVHSFPFRLGDKPFSIRPQRFHGHHEMGGVGFALALPKIPSIPFPLSVPPARHWAEGTQSRGGHEGPPPVGVRVFPPSLAQRGEF